MKKIILAALMAVMSVAANAQQEAGTFSITPQYGLGYAVLSNFDNDIKGGLQSSLGADFRYQVNEQFGVSAGIDFTYLESDKVNKCYAKLTLFSLPVLAHYEITNHIGAFAGIRTNLVEGAKASYDDKADFDFKDNTKTYFTVPVGLKYTFNKPWVLSARYDIPVSKFNKNGNDDVKVGGFMVTIGYRFGL